MKEKIKKFWKKTQGIWAFLLACVISFGVIFGLYLFSRAKSKGPVSASADSNIQVLAKERTYMSINPKLRYVETVAGTSDMVTSVDFFEGAVCELSTSSVGILSTFVATTSIENSDTALFSRTYIICYGSYVCFGQTYYLDFWGSAEDLSVFTDLTLTFYNVNYPYFGRLSYTTSVTGANFAFVTTNLYSDGYSTGYDEGYAAGQIATDAYEKGYNEGYEAAREGLHEAYYDEGYLDGVEYGKELYYDTRYEEGYTAGYDEGYAVGKEEVTTESYNEGYTVGHDEGYDEGYDKGYESGHYVGYNNGLSQGHGQGYEEGYTQGYYDGEADGYVEGVTYGQEKYLPIGYENGYTVGKEDGIAEGYENGYAVGKEDGIEEGYAEGDEDGYARGYEYGYNDMTDEVRNEIETEVMTDKETFLEGIFSFFDAPLNVIREIFNFELFGINISSLVLFALTCVIVVFVIKKIKGG